MTQRQGQEGTLFGRLPTIRRPGIFSYRSSTTTNSRAPLRPSSSNYSNSSNPDAITPIPNESHGPGSPKFGTSRFSIAAQTLPSPRLDLPHLTRTWTEERAGSRPGTGRQAEVVDDNGVSPISESGESMDDHFPGVTPPSPVLRADSISSHRRHTERRLFGAVDPAEMHLAELVGDGRRRRDRHRRDTGEPVSPVDERRRRQRYRRRHHGHSSRGREHHHHRHHQRHHEHGHSSSRSNGESRATTTRPTPKRFLFCFPWIRSRRIRSNILRCFVSGSFLALLLTVCECWDASKRVTRKQDQS
jgi:hypothetical protein